MARPKGPRQHGRVRETPAARHAPAAGASTLNGVLLDSDVVIEILRGHPGVRAIADGLEASGTPTFCTAISWAEVYEGLRPGEEPSTDAFFEARGEVVLDARAGRHAGKYLARYARSHGLEVPDALVAAAAATTGLRLWTLNRRHYPMKDVRVFDVGSAS
ncbi:MAG TPA: PIN domain-containing protein [Candidatus Eisenbacteria bacterium]